MPRGQSERAPNVYDIAPTTRTTRRVCPLSPPIWGWLAVGSFLVLFLAIDLVSSRHDNEQPLRRAIFASGAWIGVSVAFGVLLGSIYGWITAQQYFASYVVEKSLSIDNIFVFALLFGTFAVPASLQHRVLYYGVVGALVLRAAFIAGGVALLDHFSWVLYVFGAMLVIAGVRMVRNNVELDPRNNRILRAVTRHLPVTRDYVGNHFFTRIDGRLFSTPLFVALVAIEVTDVAFASDSIPAIFGVTTNVFVIFTSNAFAVLGLRALYFVFAGAMRRFRHLRYGLASLLVLIGVKLLGTDIVHVPTIATLIVVVLVIGVSILVSAHSGEASTADCSSSAHDRF
jgi:tellurite resistance protein TerC